MKIMLSRRLTDTILWKGPPRIQDGHQSMLLKHWRKCSSLNLPARRQNETFGADIESDLTACSSQEMQIWCRCGKNLTESKIENSWRTSSAFYQLFTCPDTISGLGVTTFWSWLGCWNSVLDRIRNPEISKLFTPNQIHSQGTSNSNIVSDYLSFPVATPVPQSD
jgi:hypothetical protein